MLSGTMVAMSIRNAYRLGGPLGNGAAVTTSDSINLTQTTRALLIGSAGNVSVVMAGGGNTVVLNGLQAGQLVPVEVLRVNLTGTTATNIVALW